VHTVDPHMHIWDTTNPDLTGHDKKILGAKYPIFAPEDYVKNLSESGVTLKKAVFVECISAAPLKEAQWVHKLVNEEPLKHIKFGIVPFADLRNPNCEELLRQYSQIPEMRGIRQILNHHPTNPSITWPHVTEDVLKNETWRKNFGLLGKFNFSFDMQLNPHQMEDAVSLIRQYPNITVIINHLGCLHPPENESERNSAIEVWKRGISQLASCPNVFIKISMLEFTAKDWPTNPMVKDAVNHVISNFGTSRCMFASNFPVDIVTTTSKFVYDGLKSFAKDLPQEKQRELFYTTAERAYRLN